MATKSSKKASKPEAKQPDKQMHQKITGRLGKQHQPIELNYLASLGILPLRLMGGLGLVMHGIPKLAHATTWMEGSGLTAAPGYMQAMAAVIQVFGGACIFLGLLTPAASLGIFTVMVVAVFKRLEAGQYFITMTGAGTGDSASFELAALYICLCLLMLTTGPGRFSLDAKLFGHRKDK